MPVDDMGEWTSSIARRHSTETLPILALSEWSAMNDVAARLHLPTVSWPSEMVLLVPVPVSGEDLQADQRTSSSGYAMST
jgi:hypothetical protein